MSIQRPGPHRPPHAGIGSPSGAAIATSMDGRRRPVLIRLPWVRAADSSVADDPIPPSTRIDPRWVSVEERRAA